MKFSEDQIYSLEKRNIKAEILCQSTDKEVVNSIHNALKEKASPKLRLLYVTPERLKQSKRFMSALQKCHENGNLARIAIDEVHCCSCLGHDFRRDYLFLGTMKTLFPDVPILGVTATASRKVLSEIQKMLNIRGSLIMTSPFNRPNLYYGIIEKPIKSEETIDILVNLLKNRYKNQCGIIYTFSIKDTEMLANELMQEGCGVRAYHAELSPGQRSKVYKKWMNDEIQAVVATIAFGMGIDKPDVRFVIHHTMSKSMENFYQESGRCGRDGKYAECILLYKFADIFKISSMTFSEVNGLENTYSMVKYCINSRTCRRDLFSNYFTEVWDEENCGKMCDHCFDNQERKFTPPKVNIFPHYITLNKILDQAHLLDTKMTALKLIEAWFNKGPKPLRLESTPPPEMDRSYAEQIIAFLITENYLHEDISYTPYNTISYIKCGRQSPVGDEIEFQGSSIQKLPPAKSLRDFYETVTSKKAIVKTKMKQETTPTSRNNVNSPATSTKRSLKRRISISEDSDDENISLNQSALEKLIDSKVELKIKKLLKKIPATPSRNMQTEDVVIVKTENDEVIEIE